MRLKHSTFRPSAFGLIFLAACSSERGGGGSRPGAVIVDNEVRGYIENSLRPYLASLAKATCTVRATAAAKAGRYGVCVPYSKDRQDVERLEDPKAEGVTLPPKDGKPFPRPEVPKPRADSVDNEVSGYIENDLRPYLASLAKVTCAVRATAAPKAARYGVCVPLSQGDDDVEPLGDPKSEGTPTPPKNRAPYPNERRIPLAADNEVRNYIEKSLLPYVTSLAQVACGARVAAAPKVGRYGICVPYVEGSKGVKSLGDPVAEGTTLPPKDGRPYPPPDSRRQVTDSK